MYPMDPQLALDGSTYHKGCAKCADCKCSITLANFTKCDSVLLCKTHYFQRFHEQGTYLGGDKFENKSTRDSIRLGGGVPVGTTPSLPSSAPPAEPVNIALDGESSASASGGGTSDTSTSASSASSAVDVKTLSSAINSSPKAGGPSSVPPAPIGITRGNVGSFVRQGMIQDTHVFTN